MTGLTKIVGLKISNEYKCFANSIIEVIFLICHKHLDFWILRQSNDIYVT